MANAGWTGNWHRLKVNGKLESEGDRVIRGINVRNPACFPAMISASMMCFWKEKQTNLVPLQRLSDGWILCNTIIGDPTFNDNWWWERPPI